MNGIAMWIILSVLISIVILFLIITSVLGRKKRKKIQQEENKIKKIKKLSIGKTAITVNLIIDFNKNKLKTFIPSIGKLKMSDINNLVKKEYNKIKQTDSFKYLKNNNIFMHNFNKLFFEKSNNWEKKNKEQFQYFKNIEKKLEKIKYVTFLKKEKNRLEKVYK